VTPSLSRILDVFLTITKHYERHLSAHVGFEKGTWGSGENWSCAGNALENDDALVSEGSCEGEVKIVGSGRVDFFSTTKADCLLS
jgi:hypothetical protein